MALLDAITHRHRRIAVAAAVAATATLAMAAPVRHDAPRDSLTPVEPARPSSLIGDNPITDVPRQRQTASEASGGFVYRSGLFGRASFRPLSSVPGAVATAHIDINNRGQLVGVYGDATGNVRSFVEDRGGHVTTFEVPGAALTLAGGINDRGQTAGTYFDPGATPGQRPFPSDAVHGFVRNRNGTITTIDLPPELNAVVTDINNRGQLAGVSGDIGQARAFLWHPNGSITRIQAPGPVGETVALNDRGQVVGYYDGDDGNEHGFVWSRGRLTTLDVPGATRTAAFGTNNRGDITGAYADADGTVHGFLLRRGRYTTIDAPNRTDTTAWGINDLGQIVIPEPGTGLAPR